MCRPPSSRLPRAPSNTRPRRRVQGDPTPPYAWRSSGYKLLLSASGDEPRDDHTPPRFAESETTSWRVGNEGSNRPPGTHSTAVTKSLGPGPAEQAPPRAPFFAIVFPPFDVTCACAPACGPARARIPPRSSTPSRGPCAARSSTLCARSFCWSFGLWPSRYHRLPAGSSGSSGTWRNHTGDGPYFQV